MSPEGAAFLPQKSFSMTRTQRARVGFSFLIFFLAAGILVRAAGESLAARYAPVLKQATDLGILHNALESRTVELAEKTLKLEANPAAVPPEAARAVVGAVVQYGITLPDTLRHLNDGLTDLHDLLLQDGVSAFDVKFTAWKEEYDATMVDAADLQDSARILGQNASGPTAKTALSDSARILRSLHQEIAQLHTRFQVIANLLEIFSQSRFKKIPPSDRILGETWLQHEERTGHWGVADPHNPTKIFTAHSIYAIRDSDPRHDVWACEASIKDFLEGRVKGQEHPYQNAASIPFCYRCHSKRNGYHNFPWCIYDNSGELIRACQIIEETSTPKR